MHSSNQLKVHLFNPSGRFRRIPFIVWICISNFILLIGIGLAFSLLMIASTFTEPQSNILVILAISFGVILTILIIITNFIFIIRRLHDCNYSGWFSVLIFIPYLNVLFILYLVFAKGNVENNDYGSP